MFPLPKQMPPKSVENDIRPISLTNQVAKIMEGFTLTKSVPGIYEDLDCKQFAAAGLSTQHAIGHFRITFGLFFKASPGAHLFI